MTSLELAIALLMRPNAARARWALRWPLLQYCRLSIAGQRPPQQESHASWLMPVDVGIPTALGDGVAAVAERLRV